MVRRADGLIGGKDRKRHVDPVHDAAKNARRRDHRIPTAWCCTSFARMTARNSLGLVKVMTAHKVDEPVSVWGNGTKLLLTVIPWESATAADPRLSHIQILDETSDFTHPRASSPLAACSMKVFV